MRRGDVDLPAQRRYGAPKTKLYVQYCTPRVLYCTPLSHADRLGLTQTYCHAFLTAHATRHSQQKVPTVVPTRLSSWALCPPRTFPTAPFRAPRCPARAMRRTANTSSSRVDLESTDPDLRHRRWDGTAAARGGTARRWCRRYEPYTLNPKP